MTRQKILTLLSSRRFFLATIGLFIVEALAIALTGRYPMAFDEDFHLGIIRIYASHISPFLNGQPSGADAFGAVARDPSYLYQYLMSFPYRFICIFTQDQTLQVLFLRCIDIALFTWSLFLFRVLLLKTGASKALVHLSILLFVLIPIVPLLAAQINYDNLVIPLTALSLLAASAIDADLKKSKRLDMSRVLALVSLLLLSSIVKYAFLPIALAITIFLAIRMWRRYGSWSQIRLVAVNGFRTIAKWQRRALVALVLVSAILFGQRYFVNIVDYHTPVPDCGQVLSTEQCSHYGPWIRNYTDAQNKVATTYNPIVYSREWIYGMWLRTFFAVDGPATNFETKGPLLLPAIFGMLAPLIGLLAVLIYGKRLLRNKAYNSSLLLLLGLTALLYTATLWLDEFKSYIQTGQPVAINGRYLLPILLPVIVICALALQIGLHNRLRLQSTIAVVSVLLLVWGGGSLTYTLRSSDAWYWPAQPVYDVNHAFQKVLRPIVPGANHPKLFLH